MAFYSGIIVDDKNDSVLSNVQVLVVMNDIVQEEYGIMIADSISMTKRDSLRKLKIEDNFSKFQYMEGNKYFRQEPLKSDSSGNFSIGLHEGCVFGCPDYELHFVLEGYITYKLNGDWHSNDNLKIRLYRK